MEKHYLHDLLEPAVTKAGYELVRVMITGKTDPVLQVMIDKTDNSAVTVDDCAKVSRAVSELLDEKDPVEGKYSLEVSSPGVDRPLTKPAHFKRFKDYDVKIETSEAVEGRKRFKGKIAAADDKNVVVADGDVQYTVPYDLITKAKLLLTDELWEKYLSDCESGQPSQNASTK